MKLKQPLAGSQKEGKIPRTPPVATPQECRKHTVPIVQHWVDERKGEEAGETLAPKHGRPKHRLTGQDKRKKRRKRGRGGGEMEVVG